jgi:hypothetical protein
MKRYAAGLPETNMNEVILFVFCLSGHECRNPRLRRVKTFGGHSQMSRCPLHGVIDICWKQMGSNANVKLLDHFALLHYCVLFPCYIKMPTAMSIQTALKNIDICIFCVPKLRQVFLTGKQLKYGTKENNSTAFYKRLI